jgi:hypothetical protein
MTNDTRPPVAPKEGFYAMLRNGQVAGPITKDPRASWFEAVMSSDVIEFYRDGRGGRFDKYDSQYDIIATISPDVMAVAFDLPEKFVVAKQMGVYAELERLRALIPLADAVLDHADSHCRWFDISTAPDEEGLSFLASIEIRNPSTLWREVHVVHLNEDGEIHTDCHQGWSLGDYTHWRPLPPPPSNPPLPAVFVELGQALERLKGE